MRRTRLGAVAAIAAGILTSTASPSPAQSQAAKGRPSAATKGTSADQKAGGVIMKVEPFKKADGGKAEAGGPVRITIKTDAVWRDWVRDQATDRQGSTAKAAAKGQESIATKGEPSSPDSVATIDVVADTKIETRYRAGSDETNAGSATPGEARAKEEGKDDTKGSQAPKKLAASDLKPGLWVEVDYRHDGKAETNPASRVIVLRAVAGPQSPTKDEVKGSKD